MRRLNVKKAVALYELRMTNAGNNLISIFLLGNSKEAG